jgi:DNA polymerase IV (DinB-like DNA polymerase)
VAKIGSDFKKSDGLTVVKREEVNNFLSPLPVRRLLWVGNKTEERLTMMGIQTIGDLAKYNAIILNEKFGAMGTQLCLLAHGINNSIVQENWERKSMSREITFEDDTCDLNRIFKTLDSISNDLHNELTASNFLFKIITVKIRYTNFETYNQGRILPCFTDRLKDIHKCVKDLTHENLISSRKIRLIGVKLSKLLSTEKQTRLTDLVKT